MPELFSRLQVLDWLEFAKMTALRLAPISFVLCGVPGSRPNPAQRPVPVPVPFGPKGTSRTRLVYFRILIINHVLSMLHKCFPADLILEPALIWEHGLE